MYPITFSIPEHKIIKHIPEKKKCLATVIPGVLSTYIFTNEQDYYQDYQDSLFAVTTQKGGWDCLRHYEILANGCIPYFPDIENCPPDTMALLPKDLIQEGNLLFLELCRINNATTYDEAKNITNISSPLLEQILSLLTKLLDYTRLHLTTTAMANYVLKKTNIQVTNMLYLSGNHMPDYLRCLTLQGFKTIFGKQCHDYPEISHIYQDVNVTEFRNRIKNGYGMGFTYSGNVNPSLKCDTLDDKQIINNIQNRVYDIIVYGSCHRGLPFYEEIMKYYTTKEVVLMCGEDLHTCEYTSYFEKGHIFFMREM